jgi:DNA-binding response OmpR family regulator
VHFDCTQEVFTTAKKILIVDDEPVIADTLVIILSKAGYHARSTYTAEEALELVPAWRPDLALIDVILPRMSGVDLCIRIRTESPDCRVVLFSGASGANLLLAEAPNSFEVLPKPIHPKEILAHVARHLC